MIRQGRLGACSPWLLPETMTGIGAHSSPGPAPWVEGPENLCVTIPDQIGSSTFLGDTKGSGLYVRRWASIHSNLHRRWRTKDPGQSVLNLCSSRGFVSLCFLSVDSSSLAIQSNPLACLLARCSSCRWSCGGDICQRESCQLRLFRNKRVKGKGVTSFVISSVYLLS
jgi:hypothetical protein